MLANTIEFNGRKAVLNSYSASYVAVYGMKDIDDQVVRMQAMYPKAKVQTEDLEVSVIKELVAKAHALGPLRSLSHEIGQASEA